MASASLATYITLKAPLASLMRISRAPAPTAGIGFQSSGSRPD